MSSQHGSASEGRDCGTVESELTRQAASKKNLRQAEIEQVLGLLKKDLSKPGDT